MSTLKYIKITSNYLKTYPISAGTLIYCSDNNTCFYDANDEIRQQVTNFIFLTSDTDRATYDNINDNTIFIVDNTDTVWRYYSSKSQWFTITDTKYICDLTEIFTSLTVATATKNGIRYAPRTLASAVYTNQGQTVEDRLKLISKVGLSIIFVTATTAAQKSFELTFPFDNYIANGNSLLVYAGTIFIDPRRYTISGNTLTLADSEEGLDIGRSLTVIFIFNSDVVSSDVFASMSGAYIANGSIPYTKLEKVSDSINLNDGTSLATSQAVKNLNDTINNKLDSISGLSIYHGSVTNNTASMTLTASGFTLVDRSLVFIKISNDIAASSTLNINATGAVPIYLNYNTPVNVGLVKANTELGLVYDATAKRFYITNGTQYQLATYTKEITATAGQTVFNSDITMSSTTDKMNVYHDGLKLTEGINYTVNTDGGITLLDYSAEAGDTITFEVIKIVHSYAGLSA